MKILVSACLLGENCKYNGGNNYSDKLAAIAETHEMIPVCPEVMGGLPIPRPPAEIVDGEVINAEGISVDREYRRGAELALETAMTENVDIAVLQSRSPSCGIKEIYDGSFTGTKIKGRGITAELLAGKGITLVDIEDFDSDIMCHKFKQQIDKNAI